ncbi:MAG: hypothetical protein ACREVZ_00345 [Burkholderiales bacterium]
MSRTLILFALLLQIPVGPVPRPTASFYPHPPEPRHLQAYDFDVTFEVERKHWFWTSHQPMQGNVSIQQQRSKGGGWWVSENRSLSEAGKLQTAVRLDPTLTDPIIVLFLLSDGQKQTSSAEVKLEASKMKLGGRISGLVVVSEAGVKSEVAVFQ